MHEFEELVSWLEKETKEPVACKVGVLRRPKRVILN